MDSYIFFSSFTFCDCKYWTVSNCFYFSSFSGSGRVTSDVDLYADQIRAALNGSDSDSELESDCKKMDR